MPTSGVPTEATSTPAGPHSAEEDAEARGCIHDFSNLDRSQEDPAPDSEPSIFDAYVDLNTLSNKAQLEEMKITLAFVESLRIASLDDPCANLDDNLLSRLQNPPKEPVNIDDNNIFTGLDLFLGNINFPQDAYINSREVMMRRHPEENIPSFDQIKHIVAEITGVVPMVHHMCANSCIAYTGPFLELDKCPYCGEDRYDSKTNAAKQELHTIPLGPQLQALFRDSKSADSMSYRRRETKATISRLQQNNGQLDAYSDFIHGSDYLAAVREGWITDDDVVLMFSIDGAQLYAHKVSDCWIYIWVIFDHAPELRYKKRYVLPGTVIPGKPKNIDSFLFPGFHHLSALQREGFKIWDASRNKMFTCRPFLALGTADGPGMMHISGLVGYHGKYGCRLYCGLVGRHKANGSHYYPVLLKPNNFTVSGCSHDDISFTSLPTCSLSLFQQNLQYLVESPNDTQYKRRRLETGISKPSLFLGLQQHKTLPLPGCFGSDVMHLLALNISDLLISLWRGTFDCERTDNRSSWDWAVLRGAVWEAHGEQVAAATPYLPGSFDRPPRNPAQKISSGYKAWEYMLYLYALGPALFYNVLPEKYWKHFCKLVYGVRIIYQRKIQFADLQKAHDALIQFAQGFELLYYQRRADRIHFVRQSIHALTHLATEILRIGPGICSSQWTMERTIGNLGQEVRQPSNAFANLSRKAIQRCQVNALKAMIPNLDHSPAEVSQTALDIGNGFVLLRARDRTARAMSDIEKDALMKYIEYNQDMDDEWHPTVTRWARLRLPNGQIARSAWKEKEKAAKVRITRNVKVGNFPSTERWDLKFVLSSILIQLRYIFQRFNTISECNLGSNIGYWHLYLCTHLHMLVSSKPQTGLFCPVPTAVKPASR